MKGQTLVEVLIAFGIAVIILSSMVGAAVVSLRNAHFARDQNRASGYAHEAMETIRKIRDGDALVAGNYCMGEDLILKDAAVPGNCPQYADGNTAKVFKRSITIIPPASGPECAANFKVEVKVVWDNDKHDVTIVSCFSDSILPPP